MFIQNMILMAKVAKFKIASKFGDEKGEVNIVATVVLIGIAVILAIIFKDSVIALLKALFSTITDKATKAVE